jgi:copper chaperone NosL
MKYVTILLLILALGVHASYGGEGKPAPVSPKDKCPVCGMFVKKYPDWIARIIFKDGSYAVFDGAKDMFKYYLDPKKYRSSGKLLDMDPIYVTDYYGLAPVNGRTAWYVMGSEVYGPMGRELVPFEKKEDAAEFMKDHKGKAILRFGDVTLDILKGLD